MNWLIGGFLSYDLTRNNSEKIEGKEGLQKIYIRMFKQYEEISEISKRN